MYLCIKTKLLYKRGQDFFKKVHYIYGVTILKWTRLFGHSIYLTMSLAMNRRKGDA